MVYGGDDVELVRSDKYHRGNYVKNKDSSHEKKFVQLNTVLKPGQKVLRKNQLLYQPDCSLWELRYVSTE